MGLPHGMWHARGRLALVGRAAEAVGWCAPSALSGQAGAKWRSQRQSVRREGCERPRVPPPAAGPSHAPPFTPSSGAPEDRRVLDMENAFKLPEPWEIAMEAGEIPMGRKGSSVSMPDQSLTMAEALNDEPDLSTFENKSGLAEDMKFLASMPELCDVTFLVGDTREPVCAVKAVLAARSRVFHKMLYQAPSPQRKKEPPPRENKLRLFLKRSSEPLLNLQNAAQQRAGFTQQLTPIHESNQHQTLIIEEFEPDVFRQLIEYIHTGCVTLQPRTLLGVMNAADYYGLDELRRACAGFVQCCINVDTVCALLASAERYIQYKCTKSLVQKVLEFVDEHGNEVLNLGSFTLLPQHVVRLILAREELRADEFTKFQAALMWGKKYCDSNPNTQLKDVIGNFLEYIQFHKIPANVLMREVHPLGLVPYSIIMNALAYQADPTSVDPIKLSPNRVRRSSQGRSMSVQSSLDPYGSNTTLSSSGSSELDSGRISSEGAGAGAGAGGGSSGGGGGGSSGGKHSGASN
ncbi:serine-enriched protein isoform X1 [Cloeon dipterum]|uniref:serine-enriched protein isoform X1 n=2 Tax=Cloeon dipterum TaxID=197152 RepID=UPI003220682B